MPGFGLCQCVRDSNPIDCSRPSLCLPHTDSTRSQVLLTARRHAPRFRSVVSVSSSGPSRSRTCSFHKAVLTQHVDRLMGIDPVASSHIPESSLVSVADRTVTAQARYFNSPIRNHIVVSVGFTQWPTGQLQPCTITLASNRSVLSVVPGRPSLSPRIDGCAGRHRILYTAEGTGAGYVCPAGKLG